MYNQNNLPSENWEKYRHKIGVKVLVFSVILLFLLGIYININKQSNNKNDSNTSTTSCSF